MNIAKYIKENSSKMVDYPKELVETKIREKAVLATKARLAQHHKTFEDYNDEQLEIIIADEERKIIDDLKTKSLLVALAALGINFFV